MQLMDIIGQLPVTVINIQNIIVQATTAMADLVPEG